MSRETSGTERYRAPLAAIWAALAAVYLVWGSTYLAIRVAVETTPPFLMAGIRFLVSGGALYLWRRLSGDPIGGRADWRSAGATGLLLLVGGNGGVVWAEQFVASGTAALLVATVPLWLALYDWGHGARERPGWVGGAGVSLGFAGVALLIGSGGVEAGTTNLLGFAALLFASISWAAGSLYGRNSRPAIPQLLATAIQMLAGGAVLMLLSIIAGELQSFDPGAVSLLSALALAYLTVIGSSAFVAYVWLLRVAPTPLVSTYAYVNPLVAVLLGHFLADEPLTLPIVLGAMLIIGSVVLVSLPNGIFFKSR